MKGISMRRFFLIALLPLASCATPFEQCVANANRDGRVVASLINTTQANINRGYGVRSEEYFENEEQVCGEIEGEKVYCDVPVAQNRDVPYAIDLTAEQAKLQSLITKRNELNQRAAAVVTECRLRHPEG